MWKGWTRRYHKRRTSVAKGEHEHLRNAEGSNASQSELPVNRKECLCDLYKRLSGDSHTARTIANGRPWGTKGRVGPSEAAALPCSSQLAPRTHSTLPYSSHSDVCRDSDSHTCRRNTPHHTLHVLSVSGRTITCQLCIEVFDDVASDTPNANNLCLIAQVDGQ